MTSFEEKIKMEEYFFEQHRRYLQYCEDIVRIGASSGQDGLEREQMQEYLDWFYSKSFEYNLDFIAHEDLVHPNQHIRTRAKQIYKALEIKKKSDQKNREMKHKTRRLK